MDHREGTHDKNAAVNYTNFYCLSCVLIVRKFIKALFFFKFESPISNGYQNVNFWIDYLPLLTAKVIYIVAGRLLQVRWSFSRYHINNTAIISIIYLNV